MSFRLFISICTYCLIWVGLVGSGWADVVAMISDRAPWSFSDPDKHGVQDRFFRQLGSLSDVTISVRKVPEPAILDQLKQGKADLVILPRSEQSRFYAVPLVRLGEIDQVVIPKQDQWILGYDDLQGRQIALVPGRRLQPYFDADEMLTRRNVTTLEEGIALLSRGEVDAVAGSAPVLQYHLNRIGGYDPDRQFPYRLRVTPLWLQQSMTSTAPAPELERLLIAARQMADDGTLQELIDLVVGQAHFLPE